MATPRIYRCEERSVAIPSGPTGPFVLSPSKDIPSPSMGEGWGEGERPFVLSLSKDPVIASAAWQSRSRSDQRCRQVYL